ncbi:hypothetical protein CFHF_03675 [Caulobacter flavus]|uniref:PLD phosphodiesterase domain-containing protein n=1 Tax=Caulobacter flavus TaxID=1679497 RepID=A0A2N5CZ82_9CAUL|nr:phospholipase D-like domain-containing protein [Caulobacter flavus]AYV45200.1 hypothetical protein C1707_02495 [Caulobacter flavus]PLR19120.1 hypothetical protein CFHF_03675 [Caulobacter flavus]
MSAHPSLIDEIHRQLREDDSVDLRHEGVTYAVTGGNSLSLLQTPNLWGQDPAKNDYWTGETKPAHELVAAVEDIVAGARQSIDLSTLWPPPNGLFRDAIHRGLHRIPAKARTSVVMRVLAGLPLPANGAQAMDKAYLTHKVFPQIDFWLAGLGAPPEIPIYLCAQTPMLGSWNHAKLLIVDGREMLIGGHNMWDPSYCGFAPVHDLSVRIQGPAVQAPQAFLNRLWAHAARNRTITTPRLPRPGEHAWSRRYHRGEFAYAALSRIAADPHAPPPPASETSGRMLGLGRLGAGVERVSRAGEASATARVLAIRSAERLIRISQQDLVFLKVGDELAANATVIAALADAIHKKVEVQIVLSNPDAKDGAGAAYVAGGPLAAVQVLVDQMMRRHGMSLSAAIARCQEFATVAPLRVRADPGEWRWVCGPACEPANHAKVYIIDDRAFYVGSDNLYPIPPLNEGLQEFGCLVEDDAMVADLVETYWTPLWKAARDAAVPWAAAIPKPAPILI